MPPSHGFHLHGTWPQKVAHRYAPRAWLIGPACLLLAGAVSLPARAEQGAPRIPSLNWTPRSDWIDVATQGAEGDGVADDTAAIQEALSSARSGSTIYLAAGTYRVTQPLRLSGPSIGVTIIGHGRDTTLFWDGAEGGKLFTDDGVAYCRYVGIQFDGRRKAAVGFHHDSRKRFETEVRHQHLAFRNFTDAAILVERKDKYATAETQFLNCLFEDCGRGVVFVSFNDYNYTFDGCEFRRCGTAIHCSHGNFYARNCHFEGSTGVDIRSAPEHASSVRRCTSLGSRAFIRHANSVSPLIVQDCQVAGWTDPNGAITVSGAPVTIFDCVFQGGPAGRAPIRIGRPGQRLITSVNRVEGGGDVIQTGHRGRVYDIPAGKRRGVLTSPRQRFLTDEARIPGKVFDAKRAFGARGDGRTDDAAAVQRAFDAAREHGRDAIAYLPTGRYAIGKTLRITGRDYFVGGTGFQTQLIWKGAPGGTMVEIHDPLNVSLENIAVGNHDSGKMSNAIDILQTGSGRTTLMTYDWVFVYGMYQKKPFRKGLHLRGLGTDDTVLMPHVQGNLRIIDSARATILANCTYEGSVVVEGRDRRRDGFLGFLTRLSTITKHGLYLRDNHSIVMSDFYVEQADDGFVLEGSPDLPAGRATIQGPKVDFSSGKGDHEGTVLDIRNYGGQIFSGPNQFYASLPRVPIRHKGERKLDLFIWGSCFYKTHLEVTKDPALTLYLLGNSGVDMTAKRKDLTPEGKAQDNMARDKLAPLARALDDLRRLGALDLRLTHPHVGRPKK